MVTLSVRFKIKVGASISFYSVHEVQGVRRVILDVKLTVKILGIRHLRVQGTTEVEKWHFTKPHEVGFRKIKPTLY